MSLGSGTGAHMASGGRGGRPGAGRALAVSHVLGRLSRWQAACLSKQQIWPASGFVIPCRRESPATLICCRLFRWGEFQAPTPPLRKPVPPRLLLPSHYARSVSAHLLVVKELFSCCNFQLLPPRESPSSNSCAVSGYPFFHAKLESRKP